MAKKGCSAPAGLTVCLDTSSAYLGIGGRVAGRADFSLPTPMQAPCLHGQVGRSGALTTIRARADWSPQFAMHELASVAELLGADPVDYADDRYHYLWTWTDAEAGHIRARMFANELGVPEDEATGSAAVRLTDSLRRALNITQGAGSQIHTTWNADGWVLVGGRVVSDGVRQLE